MEKIRLALLLCVAFLSVSARGSHGHSDVDPYFFHGASIATMKGTVLFGGETILEAPLLHNFMFGVNGHVHAGDSPQSYGRSVVGVNPYHYPAGAAGLAFGYMLYNDSKMTIGIHCFTDIEIVKLGGNKTGFVYHKDDDYFAYALYQRVAVDPFFSVRPALTFTVYRGFALVASYNFLFTCTDPNVRTPEFGEASDFEGFMFSLWVKGKKKMHHY